MGRDIHRFDTVAIVLHWCIAFLVLCAVALGLARESLDRGTIRDTIFALHKSIGLLILIATCIRLGWRLTHRVPPPPAGMGAFQRFAAWSTHSLLYVMMFVQPITGYLAEAARARQTTFFWLMSVPRLGPLDRQLAHAMETAHNLSQYALYVLLVAHIGAALYHRFVLRDGVLARMWPFGVVPR